MEEICDQNIRLRNYYVSGMTINAIPISIEDGGVVKASLKDTDSNPQKLIDNEYAVGNIVKAIVQEAEDILFFPLTSVSLLKTLCSNQQYPSVFVLLPEL